MLKIRFEAAGITRCEICGTDNFLGFAHAVKRRKLRADAEIGSPEHIETVVLLCNEPCHLRIERMKPEEMSAAVMALIARRKIQPTGEKMPFPKPVKGQKQKLTKAEPKSTLVLIEISGGVGEVTGEQGNVETCLIDWNNINGGDAPPENWEKFAHLRPDLKKDIEGALAKQTEEEES